MASKDAQITSKIISGQIGEDTVLNVYELYDIIKYIKLWPKDIASFLLQETNNPVVISHCFEILSDKSFNQARYLLEQCKNEWSIIACIRVVGRDVEDTALSLIKNTKNRFIRDACREIISSWSNSLGSKSSELDRLKKNDSAE